MGKPLKMKEKCQTSITTESSVTPKMGYQHNQYVLNFVKPNYTIKKQKPSL